MVYKHKSPTRPRHPLQDNHINIGEDNFEYLGSPDHKRWMSIKGEKPADENQDAA